MTSKNNVDLTIPDFIPDSLNPERGGQVHLQELVDPTVNPYIGSTLKVRIFAILPPPYSIKQYPGLGILTNAYNQGRLKGIKFLVMPTSGNLPMGMSPYAKFFGIQQLTAITPFDIAPGKRETLKLTGIYCVEPNKEWGETSMSLAKVFAENPDRLLIDQYTDPANPASYEQWFMPSVWKETEGKLTVLGIGVGSTGCVTGCRSYIQKQSLPVHVVGGICGSQNDVPGVRNVARLNEIGFDCDTSPFPIVRDINGTTAFNASGLLIQAGIFVGPSSGLSWHALMQFIKGHEQNGTLDQLRNSDGEVVGAFVCGDDPRFYWDKYTTHLRGGIPHPTS